MKIINDDRRPDSCKPSLPHRDTYPHPHWMGGTPNPPHRTGGIGDLDHCQGGGGIPCLAHIPLASLLELCPYLHCTFVRTHACMRKRSFFCTRHSVTGGGSRPPGKRLRRYGKLPKVAEDSSDLHYFWSDMIAPDFFSRPSVCRPSIRPSVRPSVRRKDVHGKFTEILRKIYGNRFNVETPPLVRRQQPPKSAEIVPTSINMHTLSTRLVQGYLHRNGDCTFGW